MALFHSLDGSTGYQNPITISTIAGHPVKSQWIGSEGEIGVASFLYKGGMGSPAKETQFVVVKHNSQWRNEAYITPEAALEMAFALFDIVEKVKPELIQNVDGPKA